MKTKSEKKSDCTGTIGFCWPWYENFTNQRLMPSNNPKGLGWQEMTNIKLDKRSRDIPILVYGPKKIDSVVVNYCPWCGADYRKLGRI